MDDQSYNLLIAAEHAALLYQELAEREGSGADRDAADKLMKAVESSKDSNAALIQELVNALMSALNIEYGAKFGYEVIAKANQTHVAMDVLHHFDKIREALAAARRAGFEAL